MIAGVQVQAASCPIVPLLGTNGQEALVPDWGNDGLRTFLYNRAVVAKPYHDWYLKEWLAAKGEHATVAWFEAQTGWTHRIASQLVNRKLRWNRDHLALAAKVLQIAPYELMLHPDEAYHIRRLRTAVEEEHRLRTVASDRDTGSPMPAPASAAGQTIDAPSLKRA